jgi:hypothetical protein
LAAAIHKVVAKVTDCQHRLIVSFGKHKFNITWLNFSLVSRENIDFYEHKLSFEIENKLNYALNVYPSKWGKVVYNSGSRELGLQCYPPASEASRGVYWNQAQKNFPHPYTEYPWVSVTLWLCDSDTLWLCGE